mmetsp:Transcript_32141/g.81888  ORF Transcript_32141/g.81888 Transcript_32141/m.81888 type:complete len:279 (+) Transcript_32141:607-1443(+)
MWSQECGWFRTRSCCYGSSSTTAWWSARTHLRSRRCTSPCRTVGTGRYKSTRQRARSTVSCRSWRHSCARRWRSRTWGSCSSARGRRLGTTASTGCISSNVQCASVDARSSCLSRCTKMLTSLGSAHSSLRLSCSWQLRSTAASSQSTITCRVSLLQARLTSASTPTLPTYGTVTPQASRSALPTRGRRLHRVQTSPWTNATTSFRSSGCTRRSRPRSRRGATPTGKSRALIVTSSSSGCSATALSMCGRRRLPACRLLRRRPHRRHNFGSSSNSRAL